MRLAFYAPLKPPDHPVPSGDRRMAQLLMAALAARGHDVELASRLRRRDGAGPPARQLRLAAGAG
ncbi:MAG: glycosyl transferase, partial [Alphaproteobacteria bacterium]